ncbi:MAG: hypothetical protein JXA41_13185, partial [Deltaproteobacteria bacterium]|nr:hypothetical protein [Deltaproteobacteria bacterium]
METADVSTQTDKSKIADNDFYVLDRIGKMRDRLLSTSYKLDLDRARHYTKAYKQTEGQPACIRAARGLEETLRNMPISIADEELIVGSKSSKDFSDPLYIETSVNYAHIRLALSLYGSGKTLDEWVAEDPEHRDVSLGTRGATFSKDVPNISEEEYRELKEEIVPYWKDKTVNAR